MTKAGISLKMQQIIKDYGLTSERLEAIDSYALIAFVELAHQVETDVLMDDLKAKRTYVTDALAVLILAGWLEVWPVHLYYLAWYFRKTHNLGIPETGSFDEQQPSR